MPQPPALSPFPLSRRGALAFGLAAAVFFTILAWAITVFYREQSFPALFTQGRPIAVQLVVGLLAGCVLGGLIAAVVLHSRPLAPLRDFVIGLLAGVRPTGLDIVVISFGAGFSEELFFRATLQPMWGLWLASLAFALAHVGGNVFTFNKAAFAAYVFAMGLLFGLMYQHAGLIAAMITHGVCNMVFLFALKRYLIGALSDHCGD